MSTTFHDENQLCRPSELPKSDSVIPPSAPVKTTSLDEEVDSLEPLLHRLHRAFGPLAGALILDTADFVTFGPIGLVLGLFVGASTAWWISSIYEYQPKTRAIWAAVAGLYCMMPLTAFLPLATLMSTVGRLREKA